MNESRTSPFADASNVARMNGGEEQQMSLGDDSRSYAATEPPGGSRMHVSCEGRESSVAG